MFHKTLLGLGLALWVASASVAAQAGPSCCSSSSCHGSCCESKHISSCAARVSSLEPQAGTKHVPARSKASNCCKDGKCSNCCKDGSVAAARA